MLRALLPALAALALSACGLAVTAEAQEEEFVTGPAPLVVVDTFNGDVSVVASTAPVVRVVVVRKGGGLSESEAEQLAQRVTVSLAHEAPGTEGEVVRVVTGFDGESPGVQAGADVVLEVPVRAALRLTTSNGRIDSRGTAGPVQLQTSNGSATLSGEMERITASTSNGTLELQSRRPTLVEAHVSNGGIRFSGTLAPGRSSLTTSIGTLWLGLPASSSFWVDATATNGTVEVDFPVREERASTRGRVVGQVGESAAAELTAVVSNGTVDIRRQ